MIVVDTNVIVYFYLESDMSIHAESAYRKDPNWSAPALWRSEFRNVLSICLRNRRMPRAAAQTIVDRAETLMQNHDFQIPSAKVLSLVANSKCSAYDCEFVALARDLRVPLVTVDKLILREFSKVAINLVDFVNDN